MQENYLSVARLVRAGPPECDDEMLPARAGRLALSVALQRVLFVGTGRG